MTLTGDPRELQRYHELRRELDRVRLANQRLHAELERMRAENPARRQPQQPQAGRVRAVLNPRRYLGALRRSLAGLRNGRPAQSAATTNPVGAAFTPYTVRPLHPPAADRPRILHVIANFYTGGSSQLVVDLIEHLGHRFEQEVVARDLPPSPAYVGLALHQVREPDDHAAFDAHLRRFRPDLLHVHYLGHHETAYSELDWRWYHQLFRLAEQARCRVVQNVNIPTAPYVSGAVSHYVYVSEYVKDRFGRLDARNLTIYPGSDLSFFRRENAADAPDDCIGMVYRLQGDKLNEQAIEVFLEVVRRRRQTRVIIVGGGPLLRPYRASVAAAGLDDAFTFTGAVGYRELPGHLSRMSVFVAPVHTESFGQVSPFAMGMAIPVAGYAVGALPEILGTASLLAPPGDSGRLAEIIVGLLDDRERRLEIGESNRQRAHALFTVESMIRGYEALYDEVLHAAR